MRRKKERSKQGQTNKQGKVHVCVYLHVLMRDEKEGKKKQAESNKQGKAKTNSTHNPVHVYTCSTVHSMYMYMYIHVHVHVHVAQCICTVFAIKSCNLLQ